MTDKQINQRIAEGREKWNDQSGDATEMEGQP